MHLEWSSEAEKKRFEKWDAEHIKKHHPGHVPDRLFNEGRISFEIIPVWNGIVVIANCLRCKQNMEHDDPFVYEFDLTDYKKWRIK